MFRRTKLCTGLMLAFGGTAMMTANLALAQATAPTSEGQRVEVTGTRIKSIGAVTSSPVQSVNEEEINSSQPAAVEEVIRGLPAAVPAIGPGTNNGTGGAATVDLRGLGANRTLVLIDGRRFVPFDLNAVVDTNAVPVALLRRIDLLTGGASTVYGADAVSGVVNFILKRDFQGVDLRTSYGMSEKGDAKKRRADITMGTSLADGRGSAVVSLGATNTDPLRQSERPIGVASLSSVSGNPQGSFTTVPAFFDSAQISGQINPATGLIEDTANTFNFNPLNYYQTPLKRIQGTALADFTINEHAKVYADLFYTRSDVGSNLAPSGTFFNTFSVPIGNPFIPEPARQQLCAAYGIPAASCVAGNPTEFSIDIGRRFVELGPRLNDFHNKTFQATVGVKGDVVGSWTYDAYFSRGESDQLQVRGNWGSSSKVQQALRALDPTTCIDPSNGCVPLNVFGAEGSITPEMLRFINLSAILTQKVKQDVASLSFAGDLGAIKSPMSSDPIGLVIGAEKRKMTAGNLSDSATQIQGEVLGTGAPTPDVTGTIRLNEVFTEASIPLLKNMPFARKLSLEAGYRHTEFKTTSSRNYGSYKVGSEWEPVQGVRFRAMAQRATRAPNVNELFSPQVTGLSNLAVDPCEGTNINAGDIGVAGTLTNLCVGTGVPTARVGTLPPPSAGQINELSGGNTALGPEEADTYTLGIVFEPAAVRGLVVTLDYYKINIDKAITSPSTADVLAQCYTTAFNPTLSATAPACALIGRGPGGTFNGASAPGVRTVLDNLGKIWTDGVDLEARYGFGLKDFGAPAQWGRIDVGLAATYVNKLRVQPTAGSTRRDCVGFYSIACGETFRGTNHRVKFSQRTDWTVGDFRVGYNWRHISAVREEPGGQAFLPAFSSIPAFNYVDLAFQWNVTKNAKINLSVNNLFDKKPPNVGNTIGTTDQNSGNTFPQSYDVIGRFYTVGAQLTF